MGEDATGRPSGPAKLRVSVDEAARALGLTVDAIRKRVQRGTIAHERDAAGRVRIILDASETLQDERPDTTGPTPAELKLVEALRDQVSYLREQLDAERQARTEERRRQDTIIAQLTARIPELEAPSDERESPVPSSEASEGARSPDAGGEAHSEAQATQRPQEEPRSWWRRFFGL